MQESVADNKGLCEKKHAAVLFYKVREVVALGIVMPYYSDSKENLDNYLVKTLETIQCNNVTNRVFK